MSFERLHPAIQHHIVNSLGWRTLRPLQLEAIAPVLDGSHALLLAPTAGGKTEAAILPLMSRMSSENWTGLSVLYLCPIKALLNNLHVRLSSYMSLIGRRVGIWHGDVTTGERKKLLRDPPDCLLTTPESLELMMVSASTDEAALFGRLRAVVVDEIHAFAGDDRGWHLSCVLSRLGKLAANPVQRIGLSATVGNPAELLDWLAGCSPGSRVVVNPPTAAGTPVDLVLDHVGSIENAAFVVNQLHRGEKRLVFCDSRSRAEQMAARLRSLGTTTFVSHSSLSIDERRQAEAAFASGSDCVIVATSTLELGIDVGDLDRVIQIDAPSTVRSFLQRLGRTGRREGGRRNCLFLATTSNALLHAAGLIELWRSGYVEPTQPPPKPFHVLCQQLMAIALQDRGVSRRDWVPRLSEVPELGLTSGQHADEIVDALIRRDILWEDQGLLWFGQTGQKELGYRAFSELLSVFTAEPLLKVMHGPSEIGLLHPLSLTAASSGSQAVLLGGRSWRIRNVDWRRGVVEVEPSKELGRSLWRGSGVAWSEPLCRSIRGVLVGDSVPVEWSARAGAELARIREDHGFLRHHHVSHGEGGATSWWTFAGLRANVQLATALERQTGVHCVPSNLSVEAEAEVDADDLEAVLRQPSPLPVPSEAIELALEAIKFAEYLPAELQASMIDARLRDDPAVECVRTRRCW